MQVSYICIYCKKERAVISPQEIIELIGGIEQATTFCSVEIETEPANVEVWLAGQFIDWSPCTLQVLPGTHVMTCKIPPKVSVDHEFTCAGTDPIQLKIKLPSLF